MATFIGDEMICREVKYRVDGWNNFCRVFELPDTYPAGFCFGGGHRVNFQMIDWFNPVPNIPQPGIDKASWERVVGPIQIKEIDLRELEETLVPYLRGKNYIKAGKKYLVLYDFGACTVFTGLGNEEHE